MPKATMHQNRMQSDAVQPVVEDARLPEMEKEEAVQEQVVRPRRAARGSSRMADAGMISGKAELLTAERRRLDLMPSTQAKAKRPARKARPMDDQEERQPEEQPGGAGGGYVRLRLRVQQGEIHVVGVRSVEGPLLAEERLYGDLVYEVTLDQRVIGWGSIPDAGVMRSYPPPQVPPDQQGHFITELPSYEFTVRVPREDLSERALPRLGVTVYRVKGPVPEEVLGLQAPSARFADQLRPVARLQGIRIRELPENLQERMRQALE